MADKEEFLSHSPVRDDGKHEIEGIIGNCLEVFRGEQTDGMQSLFLDGDSDSACIFVNLGINGGIKALFAGKNRSIAAIGRQDIGFVDAGRVLAGRLHLEDKWFIDRRVAIVRVDPHDKCCQ